MEGGQLIADKVSERIEWLVRDQLQFLGNDSSAWGTLYRDPRDGRLWERTYPMGEMHGGGPPQLVTISAPAAAVKYPSLDLVSPPPG